MTTSTPWPHAVRVDLPPFPPVPQAFLGCRRAGSMEYCTVWQWLSAGSLQRCYPLSPQLPLLLLMLILLICCCGAVLAAMRLKCGVRSSTIYKNYRWRPELPHASMVSSEKPAPTRNPHSTERAGCNPNAPMAFPSRSATAGPVMLACLTPGGGLALHCHNTSSALKLVSLWESNVTSLLCTCASTPKTSFR